VARENSRQCFTAHSSALFQLFSFHARLPKTVTGVIAGIEVIQGALGNKVRKLLHCTMWGARGMQTVWNLTVEGIRSFAHIDGLQECMTRHETGRRLTARLCRSTVVVVRAYDLQSK
jgi:hypothetical protein